MIYSIANYDFFHGNLLFRRTVVLPEIKFMEINVPNLETHIDILTNNVLSGKNDCLEQSRKNQSKIIGRLDPKLIITIFKVISLWITLTTWKWNLKIKFHTSFRLHTCRSTPRMIHSTKFFVVKSLLSGKNIYDRIENKMPNVF